MRPQYRHPRRPAEAAAQPPIPNSSAINGARANLSKLAADAFEQIRETARTLIAARQLDTTRIEKIEPLE